MRCYGRGDEVSSMDLCKALCIPGVTGRIPLSPISWGRCKMKLFPAIDHSAAHVSAGNLWDVTCWVASQPLCALCSHLKMDGNLLANQSCHRFHSVLIMTSSATSFSHCLCVITSAAILWMLEFLTSGRAQANSSQTLFINDGCINLFPCQWKPRILAFRLSKFGLAKSCSIDTSVSNTLWSLCATALVPNTREIPPLQGYHIQNKCEFFCSFDVPWFCP